MLISRCCLSWLVLIFAVVLAEKPKLLDFSKKVEEAVGQSTVISCNFESTAINFTIAWLKDGSPMTFDKRVFAKLLGKTNGALFLNSLKLSDKGTYTCRGKNDAGFTDGTIEVDLIKVAPKIQPISTVYLQKNQGINLTCTSTAVPQATHKWTKKNGIFGSNAKEHKGGVLEILNLVSSKEVYTCTATNVVGDSSIDVEIVEVTKLDWIEVPKDVNVSAGQSFTYTLSVVSLSEPKVLWYKNHMLIPKDKYDYTWMRIGSKYTSQLQFNDLSVSDTGTYRAEVDLGLLSPYQKNGKLTVYAKPDIKIEEGVEVFAAIGSSVTFTCIAYAYPKPSLRWEKNGTVILQADPSNSEVDGFRTTFTYVLKRVEEAGYYTCAGQNNQGSSEAMVKLNVYPASGGGSSSNRTAIISVVVVSVILCIIIIAAVIIYVKYRDRICITEYTQASGKFYTDVVDEEREISNLNDYENNTNVIKKNINISIKRGDRSNSIAHGGNQKANASFKGRSLRQTIKGLSMKRPSNAFQENHYARLGTVVTQGKSIDFKHIVFDECLGHGEYGMVCGGRIIDDDNATVFKEVSIKMLRDDSKAEHRRDMLEELRMMRRISKHRNVISLIGWCVTDDNVYVVEEYVPFGSLLTFLRAQRCLNQSSEALDQLPEEDRVCSKTLLSFAVQIASGMTHLAQLQVVHRDLACRNVYLGHEKTCKISEYGLVRDIYAENVYRKTTGGQLPVRWMARESVFEGLYSTESDVWSFGILLWELINLGKIPYPGIVRTEHLLKELESGYHMENPGHISTDLFLTMSSCWNRDPLRRPSFEKLEKDLRNYLDDTDEVHIDLSKMLQSEVDEELACDDDIIQSPTTDFHRPNFGGLKDVAEEDEETANNDDVNV